LLSGRRNNLDAILFEIRTSAEVDNLSSIDRQGIGHNRNEIIRRFDRCVFSCQPVCKAAVVFVNKSREYLNA